MLAFGFDIVGGYLIALFVRNLWFAIPAAIIAGMVSSAFATFVMSLFGEVRNELINRALAEFLGHPVVVVTLVLWFRRWGLRR